VKGSIYGTPVRVELSYQDRDGRSRSFVSVRNSDSKEGAAG